MTYDDVIEQVIDLKKQHDLLEEDATDEKQREWYSFLLQSGLLEIVERDGKVAGFAECVRYDNVLFVCNLIASGKDVVYELKSKIRSKHSDRTVTMWHRKKDNQMVCVRRKT